MSSSPTSRSLKKMRDAGYRRREYTKVCGACNAVFHPHRKSNRFCSRVCGAAGRVGPRRKHAVTVYCSFCGKPHKRKESASKRRFMYCGAACKSKHLMTRYAGEQNPNFSDAGRKQCSHCKREFVAYNKARRFCSHQCASVGASLCTRIALRKGSYAERELGKILRSQGYHVTRSSGSRGMFDIVAVSSTEVRLIQVKATCAKHRMFPKKCMRRLASLSVPRTTLIKKQMAARLDGGLWMFKDV